MAESNKEGFVQPGANEDGRNNRKDARETNRKTSVEIPLFSSDGWPHIMVSVGHENLGAVGYDQYRNVTINTRMLSDEDGHDETEYLAIPLPAWIKDAVTEGRLEEILRSLRPDLQGEAVPYPSDKPGDRLQYLIEEIGKARESAS